MSELLKLAERCEKATGPDRELDALLHCVREELEFVCIGTGREAYGSICDPSDSGYGTANTTTPGMLYARYPDHKNPGKRGNIVQGCRADSYTASLDAAMTLVPEGVSFALGKGIVTELGGSATDYAWCGSKADPHSGPYCWAATPALALCAAALRAREEDRG